MHKHKKDIKDISEHRQTQDDMSPEEATSNQAGTVATSGADITKKTANKKKHVLITEDELETLKKAKEELEDKLLRLQADFENIRKRLEKEKYEYIKYASESIIAGLLHIIDDFERALGASKTAQDFSVLHQGIEMILKHLEEFLAKKGLIKIETIGQVFDPLKHEAIEVVIDDAKPENTVIEEIKAGYTLHGKVVRAAMVKISKKSESTVTTKEEGL